MKTPWYEREVALSPWLSLGRLDVRLEFKAADLWVGLFVRRTVFGRSTTLFLFLCLLPCVCVRIIWHPKKIKKGGA
jgi:hypothetical protein